MKVKYYTGRTLAEAIGRAKREHGSDIILLDSKELKTGNNGSKLVQVSISVDEKKSRVKPWTPPSVNNALYKPKQESEVETREDFNAVISKILARKPKTLDQEKQILEELAELKEQISQLQIKNAGEEIKLPPNYQTVLQEMIKKGFSRKMAEALIKKTYQFTPSGPNASLREIIRAVKNELRPKFKIYDLNKSKKKSDHRVIMLVGPTGAGKTTMTMKLAAHPRIFAQKETVIISADPYGPSEALKAFSKMSGVPVIEKKREDELSSIMQKLDRYEVVLVDVAGNSPFAPNFLKKMEEYVKIVKPDEIILVAAMNMDIDDLFASAALYLLLKPSGIILTKFDETTRVGKFFSLMEELELPVAAFGEGKRIFIDIALPEESYIFEKVFEEKA
ncbi:MAG: hypothetical protein GXO77_13585 [Calditrichaeota bacterium]|nr:hypothetical protein [Calditrichota bacterium]